MRCELELSAATKFSMRSGSRSCEVIKYKKGKKFSTLIFIHRFSHGKMCKEFIFHLSWSSLNSKEVSGFPATRMCVCEFFRESSTSSVMATAAHFSFLLSFCFKHSLSSSSLSKLPENERQHTHGNWWRVRVDDLEILRWI